jgi:hypothetical protein
VPAHPGWITLSLLALLVHASTSMQEASLKIFK